MQANEQSVRAVLATVIDPNTHQNLLQQKSIRMIQVEGSTVVVEGVFGYPIRRQMAALEQRIVTAIQTLSGVLTIQVTLRSEIGTHVVKQGLQALPNIKNIIAVSSAKGGVGKSTVAVNMALSLVAEGAKVGILDADIYGPSIPTMLGVEGPPELINDKEMAPLQRHGLQIMSIGFLVDADQAMIWRGPMVVQALNQLFLQTRWQDLDYLIVDMPPGTGDIQLSLSQKFPVTGVVVVTTPQDIALVDTVRGMKMFEKVGVPILGVVENMAMHCCSQCGHQDAVFGELGGQRMSEQHQLAFLGTLPLDRRIREHADQGCPTVVAEPDGQLAAAYGEVARRVAVQVALSKSAFTAKIPPIVVHRTK